METTIWTSYEIGQHLSKREVRLVNAAWEFAHSAHTGQVRASGVPFIQHPLAVAQILSSMRLDGTTLAAGLLHDVVEDTAATSSEIRCQFGAEIGDLVAALTINTSQDQTTGEESVIQTVRTILADRRLVLIRIADRLHNMRTLGALPRTRRKRIAYETLVIYVPLAECLGLVRLRDELQLLALTHLNVSVQARTDVTLRSPMPLYHLYNRYVKTVSGWLFQNWIDCLGCGIAPESWPLPTSSGMESVAMSLSLEHYWGNRGALPNLGHSPNVGCQYPTTEEPAGSIRGRSKPGSKSAVLSLGGRNIARTGPRRMEKAITKQLSPGTILHRTSEAIAGLGQSNG